MKAVMQDPVLAKVKLIAEPWDCGPGGYQVGGFPPGWAEWNDKFRDTVRDYWRGEATPAQLAPRLCGSPDSFSRRGRQPWASVNFITAHDGFTLNDLVSYNDKHNEANGEENRDGHSHNRSWNHGAEGPDVEEPVRALRKRQMKNLLATLLLSQGTPMLLAGDEFGHSQQGNNNAYCQDNEISWLHWNHDDREQRLINFVRKLTGLREKYPTLRRARWLTGEYNEELEVKDVTWINTAGEEMRQDQWDDPTRASSALLDGRAQETGIRRRRRFATLLIIFNPWQERGEFRCRPRPAAPGRCAPTPISRTRPRTRSSPSATVEHGALAASFPAHLSEERRRVRNRIADRGGVLYLARDVLIPFALAILLAFLLALASRRSRALEARPGALDGHRRGVRLFPDRRGGVHRGNAGGFARREASGVPQEHQRQDPRPQKAGRGQDRAGAEGDQGSGEAGRSDAAAAAAGDPDARVVVRTAHRLRHAVRQAPRHGARGDRVHDPDAAPPGSSREKPIGLIGPRRASGVTQALDEASYRVSRYLP
jgi:hypothetical protein